MKILAVNSFSPRYSDSNKSNVTKTLNGSAPSFGFRLKKKQVKLFAYLEKHDSGKFKSYSDALMKVFNEATSNAIRSYNQDKLLNEACQEAIKMQQEAKKAKREAIKLKFVNKFNSFTDKFRNLHIFKHREPKFASTSNNIKLFY